MNWPSRTVLALALLSLGVAETPGAACGEPAGGQRQPGDPCTGQTVRQETDLSFSIHPARPCAIPSSGLRPTDRRRPITLGNGLKADAAIFVAARPQEKEVSDATHR